MKMRWSNQAGSTVIEALGNVAGGLAVAALGLTLYSRAGHQNEMANSARAVFEQVQSARITAVTSATRHRIVPTDPGHLRLERWDAERGQWASLGDAARSDGSRYSFSTPDGIVFAPDGTVLHQAKITVVGADGSGHTILVPRSGRSRIE
jgi:hypothetical protein